MAVVDYGVMKSSVLINKGSQDLTLALSQSLGVDFAKAEEMKKGNRLVRLAGTSRHCRRDGADIGLYFP